MKKTIDLILFMGQSNMAGRGVAEKAPTVPQGVAFEYKAITEPDALCPLQEPFGEKENNLKGVYEPGMKTGSMVSSFVNAYYGQTKTPVVGVSCAKGGSAIAEWMPGTAYYQDAVERYEACSTWLENHEFVIRHRLMIWCQGCTDGDLHTTPEIYRQNTSQFLHQFMEQCQIEQCFLIQIGNHRDDEELYVPIQKEQEKLAKEEKITMVSTLPKTFAARDLMKDEFHYLQEGYNMVGEDAGRNTGMFVQSMEKSVV